MELGSLLMVDAVFTLKDLDGAVTAARGDAPAVKIQTHVVLMGGAAVIVMGDAHHTEGTIQKRVNNELARG